MNRPGGNSGVRIPYVQSAASQQVPPPYHFPGVTVNAFTWQVPMDRVQHYCDRFFNLGAESSRDYVYRPVPLWPFATLLFLNYPIMISAAPASAHLGEIPYADRGMISQTEVFVALPVMRYGKGPAKLILDSTLEFALPFIVVANPMSSVCGREMLGLGKLLADIGNSEGAYPDSFLGTVKLPGWPSLEPGAKQIMQDFMRVETKPALPTSAGTQPPQRSLATLLESREASWMMGGLASMANYLDTASLGLIPTSMRTVGLKQYRDALDPSQAIYQALVTCRAQYTNVRNVRFYNEKDVNLTFYDTGSFHDILKVFLDIGDAPTGQPISVSAAAGCRFEADIDYDQMRVIRGFPVDRGDGLPPSAASSDLIARWARPLQGFFGPRQGGGPA